MEPVLPPTIIKEIENQKNRISNTERILNEQTIEPYLINKPASINFVKYSRANTNFSGTKEPSDVDRIQSNWVSLPYPVNISTVYVTHKTEHLNTKSFQDFYVCQIVITTNDLQPPQVLTQFTISLNKFNNLRSNPKAGLWQDEPLSIESEKEEYFQYKKQVAFEIKLPEIISIPADGRFSLIKYPIFAREEDFALTQDDNLDIDVVVLNGLSSEPINITVESTLIKNKIDTNENNGNNGNGEDVNPGPLRVGSVLDIAVDSNGKYLIVGNFDSACQQPVSNVARINPDGTLDESFNTGNFPQPNLNKIMIQPDGKILLGRTVLFTDRNITWDDRSYRGIVRINSDGSLDETWMPSGNPPVSIRGWTLLTNGKILVTVVPAISNNYSKYALLTSNGTFEKFIGPGTPNQGTIRDLLFAQSISENQALMWGNDTVQFGMFGIYNFNTDNFTRIFANQGNFSNFGLINRPQQLPKQLPGGDWVIPTTYFDSNIPGGVLRVANNLSSWSQFSRYANTTDAKSLDVDSNGKIVLGGYRIHIDGQFVGSVVRIENNGIPDSTFDASQSISSSSSAREVDKVLVLPDGKILVGGSFSVPALEGRVDRINFVRLNSDGSIDQSFKAI